MQIKFILLIVCYLLMKKYETLKYKFTLTCFAWYSRFNKLEYGVANWI